MKAAVDDLKQEVVRAFNTDQRLVIVINQPKNGQRGRIFVNGSAKELNFVQLVLSDVKRRLKLLEDELKLSLKE